MNVPHHSSSSNSNNEPTSSNSKEIPRLPLYPLPVWHPPHRQPSNNSLSSYQSAINEPLGSKWNPIVISSDEEEHCVGCRQNHGGKDCPWEYAYDQEKKAWVLTGALNTQEPSCSHCHRVGHRT